MFSLCILNWKRKENVIKIVNNMCNFKFISEILISNGNIEHAVNTIDFSNNTKIKIEETHESPLVMLIPLILLSIGAIFAGFIFKELFVGYSGASEFWGNSIFFLKPLILFLNV